MKRSINKVSVTGQVKEDEDEGRINTNTLIDESQGQADRMTAC